MLSFLGFSDDEKTNMEQVTGIRGYHYIHLWKWHTYSVVEEISVEELKKMDVVKER